jgi:hypothetical protein
LGEFQILPGLFVRDHDFKASSLCLGKGIPAASSASVANLLACCLWGERLGQSIRPGNDGQDRQTKFEGKLKVTFIMCEGTAMIAPVP